MWKFCQEIRAFSSVQLSDRKASRWHGWCCGSTVFHIASVWEPRPVYQRRQVTPPVHEYARLYKALTGTACPWIWKALQSTDWHRLSMNMEGLTKHWLAPPVHEYGRPYKALTGTACPWIWKALQSTWPTWTKKFSCLAKSFAQESKSQCPLRLTSAVDMKNLHTCKLMFDTRSFDVQTPWWWSYTDRNM